MTPASTKQQWAEMGKVFGRDKPNLEELIHPRRADEKEHTGCCATQDGPRSS